MKGNRREKKKRWLTLRKKRGGGIKMNMEEKESPFREKRIVLSVPGPRGL